MISINIKYFYFTALIIVVSVIFLYTNPVREIYNNLIIEVGEVDNLTVQTSFIDTAFSISEDDKIHVKFSGLIGGFPGSWKAPDVFSDAKGKDLKIGVSRIIYQHFSKTDLSLQIQIPQGIISTLKVQTDSGEIDVKDLSLSKILLQSESGPIRADTIEIDKLSLFTKSGDMNLNSVSVQNMVVRSQSGKVYADDLFVESLVVEGGTGDLEVACSSSNLDISSTSGKITTHISDYYFRIKAVSISGDIIVNIPDESEQNRQIIVESETGKTYVNKSS
jgi:Toastrack DUF4097